MKRSAFFLGFLLFGAGCTAVPSVPLVTPSSSTQPVTTVTTTVMGNHSEQSAEYIPFTQAGYEAVLASHEPVYIFFYASWCPYCKEQDPRTQEVFKNLPFHAHGFRVNYNDSDTDADEKTLAKKFNVTYQHTGIYLDKDGKETKREIGTRTNAQLVVALRMMVGK